MEIKRFSEAERYGAPLHHDMVAFRLQGSGATSAKGAWVGMSYFLPGGGAEFDAGAVEKIYVLIEGEMTVEFEGQEHALTRFDSCVLHPGEGRVLKNKGAEVAKMLVIVPSAGSTS